METEVRTTLDPIALILRENPIYSEVFM